MVTKKFLHTALMYQVTIRCDPICEKINMMTHFWKSRFLHKAHVLYNISTYRTTNKFFLFAL